MLKEEGKEGKKKGDLLFYLQLQLLFLNCANKSIEVALPRVTI